MLNPNYAVFRRVSCSNTIAGYALLQDVPNIYMVVCSEEYCPEDVFQQFGVTPCAENYTIEFETVKHVCKERTVVLMY